LLNEKPVHVIEVSEKGTSSRDPSTGRRIKEFEPLVIRAAVKGLGPIADVNDGLR
jgi:hypothetical protein